MDTAVFSFVIVVLLAVGEFGRTVAADQCQSNPCSNGGTCLNEYGGHSCVCPAGYSGTRCEHRQTMEGRLGFCPVVRDDMVGICAEDCTDDESCPVPLKCCSNGCGRVCTVPVVTEHMNWCMSNPCGEGTCIYNDHGYACICDAGVIVRRHCDDPPAPSSPGSSPSPFSPSPSPEGDILRIDEGVASTSIIAAVVCSVVVVAILVLGGIILYRKRNPKTDTDTASEDSMH